MRLILALAMMVAVTGCGAKYVTPGGPADFRALGITPEVAAERTDSDLRALMDCKPAASFPAAIAVARVQGPGYRSSTSDGYGLGRFTLVTTRDAEAQADIERLGALQNTRGVAPVNRLIAPASIGSQKDLRAIAAQIHADILLLYTLDTGFTQRDTTIPALGVISFGLFPNELSRVRCTASGAFVDTRTGYIYGLAEASALESSLSNAWGTSEAADRARLRAESGAFAKLVQELEKTWAGIVASYGPPPAPAAPAAAAASNPK